MLWIREEAYGEKDAGSRVKQARKCKGKEVNVDN